MWLCAQILRVHMVKFYKIYPGYYWPDQDKEHFQLTLEPPPNSCPPPKVDTVLLLSQISFMQ